MKNTIPIGDLIYERLASRYTLNPEEFVAPRLNNVGLFEFIVAVVLSQNTSDRNAWRAYINLREKLGDINPLKILDTKREDLAALIKIAGLHYNRASRLIELAKRFLEEDIEMNLLYLVKSGQLESARQKLLSLPGVGDKTADVVMLMYYNAPFFPVDTHIKRITSRVGLVERRNYKTISRFWAQNTSPRHYVGLHLLLITHGRETCKARNPRCNNCVIRDLCKYGAEI